MSDKSQMIRLEYILNLLDDVDFIVKRHGTIENAIDDREGQYAVMMCFQQIGESLHKLKDSKYSHRLPINESYRIRNIISHDYFNINIDIIKKILAEDFPKLKLEIEVLLKDEL